MATIGYAMAASSTSISEEEGGATKSSSSYSVENETSEQLSTIATAQHIPSDYVLTSESESTVCPTTEQLLSLDRQKDDPPSYYQEPSLNSGPVDMIPRLCAVSSQYAIHGLETYAAMDEPEQQYKLKSLQHFQFERLQHLPAETAIGIDSSQIAYGEDGCLYFRDY